MDTKKLFDLFDKQPLEGIEAELNSYHESFRFKIEMFIKIVIFGEQWKKSVVTLFEKSNKELDINDIDSAGEFMLYTRAWYWIEQFDLENEDCIKALNELNDTSLLASIARSIKYFESTEEFERCSYLVKVKNVLK